VDRRNDHAGADTSISVGSVSIRRRPVAVPVPSEFHDADRELEVTLDNLFDAHNYRQWIFDMIEPALGPRVLEVGAGHGTFTDLLAHGRDVIATDLSPRCVKELEERFDHRTDVTVLHCDLVGSREAGPFDSAVLVNVLEHIEDDTGALKELAAQLVMGGRLALWVPAHMQLYSDFDRSIGHYRRYAREELRQKLVDAGFVVDDIRYVNLVGAFAWWVVARQLHRAPTGKLGVTVFDRYFVPILRRLERNRHMPAGQSILALASTP
jgi:SAM-dependent methyltransferase